MPRHQPACAERQCGELLSSTVAHGGDRGSESRSKSPTLNEMGLIRDESSCYQQLAAIAARTHCDRAPIARLSMPLWARRPDAA